MGSALLSALVALAVFSKSSQAHTEDSKLSLIQPATVALDPDISLVVGPTLLFESGEWVTVSWTGIESWRFPDAFVAAFSPGTVLNEPNTITDVAPVKYQYLSAAKPFPGDYVEADSSVRLDEGNSGRVDAPFVDSLRFRLLNLRDAEGYRFGLFKGGVEAPILVAKTEEAVTFAQPLEFQHVHLALTSEADSMRVSWVTGDLSQSPAVRFREIASGAKSENTSTLISSWQEVTAEAPRSYGRDDMCGPPATTKGFHDPGLLHSVVLSGLTPGKPYEYKAGDSEADEWSKSFFFYAAPSVHQTEQSTPMASVGVQPRAEIVAAARMATLRTRGAKRRLSGLREINSAQPGVEILGGGLQGTWGPDAVKVAVFGDMGTAEVDGTLDAGHSSEVPSLRTVGILTDHLRGVKLAAGTRTAAGNVGDAPEGKTGSVGGAQPQLGLVLHIGDLSYARGYDAQWDEYMNQIEPVASAVPWMVGVGNHERDYPTTSASEARRELSFYTGTDSGGECGVPTAFRFIMPGAAKNPMADTPWYGFDFGPVHFTVMSTEHDFTPGSLQYEFIEEDLSAVDRSKTPWLVFTGHRPMYVSSVGAGAGDCEGDAALEPNCANDQPVATLLRSSLESLLMEYQVDLALYGHHHSYQRSCKVVHGMCREVSSGISLEQKPGYSAPVHVIVGMAGMGLSQNMAEQRPDWLEYGTDREFGLGMIVADSSKLQLSFILDSDEQIADEVFLTSSSPSPEPAPSATSSGTVAAPAGFVCLLSLVSFLLF